MPRTRAGWVLAVLAVLLLSTGAYAARGLLYVTFRDELPGAEGKVFGDKLDMQRTADGARVALEWAYADASSVVVGFHVEELEEGRRVAGHPAQLQPIFVVDEQPGDLQRLDGRYPNRAKLADESGNDFYAVGGQFYAAANANTDPMTDAPSTIVFAAEQRLDPSTKHRFRLEIPVEAWPLTPPGTPDKKVPEPALVGEPFVFDFEIPVRPAPIVEVNRQDTANGVTLTLERVVASPGRPQAVICFEPPDEDLDWAMYGEDMGFESGEVPGESGDDCREVVLHGPLEGRSSVTVAYLEGFPKAGTPGSDAELNEMMKTLRGPWTFEFKVPDP